jgi:sulfatase maturation enzyme AslB (radical SAM superfamily)
MINQNTIGNQIFRGSPRYYERVQGLTFGHTALDFIGINMPGRCNYACTGCLSGMEQNQNGTCQNTTIEQYLSWIEQARNLGARHIEISGEGEPLIYRSILTQVTEYATNLGMHTTIFTNGSLLDIAFLEFIREHDASIAISLSEIDPERYRLFNRNGNLERVLANIRTAQEILGSPREENNYQVYRFVVHAMVTPDNYTQIPLLSRAIGDNILFSCASVIDRTHITPQNIIDIVDTYSQTNIIHSDSALNQYGRNICGTFIYGIGVRTNGDILFDAHAYSTAGLFGNLNQTRLETLLPNVRSAQNLFLERFSIGNFCPLRDVNFEEFMRFIQECD